MRKILLMAALLIFMASLVGCDMFEKVTDDIDLGGITNKEASITDEVEKSETVPKDGAVASVVSVSATSLTIKMENNTDSTWQSGNMRDYRLEAERDGEWYSVKQIGEYANTMELMLFAPGETLTHTFEFGDRYGKLPAGKYRVVKSFWANATATTEAHEFHLVCEFTVE